MKMMSNYGALKRQEPEVKVREGWGKLFFFIHLCIVFLLFLAALLNFNWTPIKESTVENILKTCYIPFPGKNYQWNVYLSDYCSNPNLSKIDFIISTDNSQVNSKGETLQIFTIEPAEYPAGARYSSICSAFRKIAKEIKKKGGYAAATCPTLEVGVPVNKIPRNNIILIKLLNVTDENMNNGDKRKGGNGND